MEIQKRHTDIKCRLGLKEGAVSESGTEPVERTFRRSSKIILRYIIIRAITFLSPLAWTSRETVLRPLRFMTSLLAFSTALR